MKELKVRLRHRYNEKLLWERINPVLEPGEIGIESDTGRFKYGDGRRAWLNLEYAYGSGVSLIIFNGYDNEQSGSGREQVGDLSDESKVFKLSKFPASSYPGQIIMVPQSYSVKTKNEETGEEITENFIMDTPYMSLRKNGSWYWTVFSDQKNKPLLSSELGFFQLDISQLG